MKKTRKPISFQYPMRTALAAGVVFGWLGCANFFQTKPDAQVSELADEGLPGLYYQIQAGDTLWAISKKYDVPVDELLEVNGLANAQGLAVGVHNPPTLASFTWFGKISTSSFHALLFRSYFFKSRS